MRRSIFASVAIAALVALGTAQAQHDPGPPPDRMSITEQAPAATPALASLDAPAMPGSFERLPVVAEAAPSPQHIADATPAGLPDTPEVLRGVVEPSMRHGEHWRRPAPDVADTFCEPSNHLVASTNPREVRGMPWLGRAGVLYRAELQLLRRT